MNGDGTAAKKRRKVSFDEMKGVLAGEARETGADGKFPPSFPGFWNAIVTHRCMLLTRLI